MICEPLYRIYAHSRVIEFVGNRSFEFQGENNERA